MKDTIVCHCFSYSVEDIEQDVLTNSRSTIMERIMAESKQGQCRCAENNPKGR